MNSNLLIKWIDAIFPVVDVRGGKRIVWDSCWAHISKAVKEHCHRQNIFMIIIPGGCTPYLQAGDIGIYRELKDRPSATIEAWKHSNNVQYTKGGNPKAPSHSIVNSWFQDAWQIGNV